MRRLLASVLLLPLLCGTAMAQSDSADLALRAASQLDSAHRALNDAAGARDRVAALTQTIAAY